MPEEEAQRATAGVRRRKRTTEWTEVTNDSHQSVSRLPSHCRCLVVALFDSVGW